MGNCSQLSTCLIFDQASLTLDESNLNASSLGDISTDDNAVDLPIKHEEKTLVTGLSTNTNERIPILDDDDDVIVLPQEEPIITEIPDDDDQELREKCSNNHQGTGEVPGTMITSQDKGVSSQQTNELNCDEANLNEGSTNEIPFRLLILTFILIFNR